MERKIGKHTITITHPDAIWFPKSGITKGQVVEYFERIAPIMIPHMKNRPVTMHRFVDGITGKDFYHKDAPEYFPKWIKRFEVEKKDDGITNYVVCNNEATLVYLAQQACLTPHTWLSRIDKIKYPDLLIFDLDPSPKQTFSFICEVALRIRDMMEAVNLVPFVKTSGSKGLHVTVPLKRLYTFDVVRDFAKTVAQALAQEDPKNITTEIRKDKRKGRLFVDINRNAFAQTAVAPYAVRAREGAPVATPLFWKELHKKKLTAQSYTIKNIFRRIARTGDPWQDMMKSARKLP